MPAPAPLPVTAPCPCTRAPEVGAFGSCPLTDVHPRAGSLLFVQGEPARSVWYVKRGCVVLTRESHAGTSTPHAIRRAGAFVGLEALVSDTYLHTARVTSAAILGHGSRELVREWLAQGPSARMVLEQVLRAECNDSPRAATTDGTAVERVARWILAESERGQLSQVPRCFAAGLLGMAPETFSRALARLAGTGAVAVTRRRLEVRDAGHLRRLAHELSPPAARSAP